MLLDHRIPVSGEKQRTVSENQTRRRFEIPSGVLCHRCEETRTAKGGSDREIDEHDGVATVLVSAPRSIARQLLKRGGNLVWISVDVESNAFQNSGNDIANICGHYVAARGCDSFVELTHIFRSEFFPVPL